MGLQSRRFNLDIWLLALGYFISYLPYSGLIKVITIGQWPGVSDPVSGFELLPSITIATAVTMLAIITALGWWRYANRREIFGLRVPVPSGWTVLSGVGFAFIIGTTTLAYTFKGVSIILALLLMRGGVLIISPVLDLSFGRTVRWFSWVALSLSLLGLVVAFADVRGYDVTVLAGMNLAAYLGGYMLRLPCMTKAAKCNDREITRRYFVEEQLIAMPILIAVPAILALIGHGAVMMELRLGFTTLPGTDLIIPALLVGVLYAALGTLGTLIYLDRRENTFCIPLNRCSSLLSGVAASYLLAFLIDQKLPSVPQLLAASLVIVAVLFLSPLHHFNLVSERLKNVFRDLLTPVQPGEISRKTVQPVITRTANRGVGRSTSTTIGSLIRVQRVFLFVCSGNTSRSPMARAICINEIAVLLKIPFDELEKRGIRVLSAGLSARDGLPMTASAQQALQGINVSPADHNSRNLTSELVQQADVIFCMTEEQRNALVSSFPSGKAKTRCLDPRGDVGDPTGLGLEAFRNCARQLQELIHNYLREISLMETKSQLATPVLFSG